MRPEKLRAYGALTILVLALGLITTTAQAADCGSYTITTATDGGRYITDRTDVEGIQASLVGSYLNIVVGSFDGPAEAEGFAGEDSAKIPAGDSVASVCPDGSVSFTALSQSVEAGEDSAGVVPSTPVESDPMTVEVVVDIEPVFDFAGFADYMAGAEGLWQ